MTQEMLNEAVAEATGEDVRTIDGLGFVLLTSMPFELETKEQERPPLTVDWDLLDLVRNVQIFG